MKKLKQPPPATGARVRANASSAGTSQLQRPKFCLEHLQKDYCISKCTADEKAAFADRIHEMSQLTWQQLSQAPRHGQGFESIERKAIKGTFPSVLTQDVTILAFRFAGKAPMVGFRSAEVFHVVWLDRTFELYDH